MNRRSFMRTFAAAGLATPLATMRAKAAPVQDKLPVPAGKIFEGMGGAVSAMYTPYYRTGSKAGRVNEEMIEKLVEYGVKCGLVGLFVTGSTGESSLLSDEERKQVFARVAKAARGRLKLIAHVGHPSSEKAAEYARHAASVGFLDFPHFSLRGASRREIISKWRGCWRLCAVLPSRRGPRALPASAGIREIRMEHR